MKTWKHSVLFYIGGTAYMTLEFAYRGRSHGSMFLLGGTCFLLLGQIRRRLPELPLLAKAAVGSACVTVLELATGLLVNRDHTVWDYRGVPLQYKGQICLPFSLLWIPVCLGGMLLYSGLEVKLFQRR